MSETGTNVNALGALRAKVFKILVGEATPASAFLSFAPGGLPQSDYTLTSCRTRSFSMRRPCFRNWLTAFRVGSVTG